MTSFFSIIDMNEIGGNIMNKFKSHLSELIPDISGNIVATEIKNVLTVKGILVSSEPEDVVLDAIREVASVEFPNMMLALDVKINSGLTVLSKDGSASDIDPNHPLDEVGILYQGMLNVDAIQVNSKHKILNENAREVLDNIYRVLEFTVPVVLDANLKVIDGNLRLDIAKERGAREVPVIVLDTADERSEFLRLAINRSTEFQRWEYEEVDDFVDSIPQAQPLLEPLGFFGQKVLPESFFANTVIQYRIDPFNEQQTAYQQDEGLAEWAKVRRAEILEAEKKAKEQRKKRRPKENAVSLFDLMPEEDDFVETYDIDEEVRKHEEKMKEVAGTITDNYDKKRRKEMEAKGQAWQGTRRSSKQVAADRRKEFLKRIDSHTELSEEEKERIIEQLEDITTSDELEALIEGVKHDE